LQGFRLPDPLRGFFAVKFALQKKIRDTARATASATTFAGSGPLTIATLTDIASASTVAFDVGTTITNALTVSTGGLTIAGSGAVTLAAAPNIAVGLAIKNTAGVILAAETTVATGMKATKVSIISDGSNATTINSTVAPLTIAANGSIDVTVIGASITAGTNPLVTIAGSELKPGAYTATATGPSLAAGEIAVAEGGLITIAGAGELMLTLAASKVALNAGGVIAVSSATGKFGEATQTDTKITIAGTDGKAKVEAAGTVWTVSDDSAGTDISSTGKIVLGTLPLSFDETSAVTAAAGALAATSAGGTLIAGEDTTITFIGTGT
jgi:filamentous hemagglutinin